MPAKPDHPNACHYLSTVRELARIDAQIKELQEERKALVQDLPCGHYTVPDVGRFEVALTRSAFISAGKLRAFYGDKAVTMCRAFGSYRKTARRADLKPRAAAIPETQAQ